MAASRTLILATRNQGKVKELREPLARFGFDVQSLPDDFPEVPETGATFEENALLKARHVKNQTDLCVLADDSGLVVDALSGRPGIHTARYGCSEGRNLTSQEQYTLLLKEMEGMEDRRARFVSACVLMLSADRIYIVQETVEGAIAQKAMGLHGFGYDPIFLVEDTGLTASQLSPEEKDRCSHRGRAMRRIDALLEKEIDR